MRWPGGYAVLVGERENLGGCWVSLGRKYDERENLESGRGKRESLGRKRDESENLDTEFRKKKS